jgi:hypothetical protein
MGWLAISSVGAARMGISGWVTLWSFFVLFLLALWLLDDPGEDWPPYVWVAPFVCLFVKSLAMTEGSHDWRVWLVGYILVAVVTWLTTGPWLSCMTWRRPVLAAIAPVLLWLSMGIGGLAQRWLPELLLK